VRTVIARALFIFLFVVVMIGFIVPTVVSMNSTPAVIIGGLLLGGTVWLAIEWFIKLFNPKEKKNV
jgi:hypothetical protein